MSREESSELDPNQSGSATSRKEGPSREGGPRPMGPADLIKAIGSLVIGAIVTLVVVWLLIFAATRGDPLGWALLIGLLTAITVVAYLRRSR